MKLLAYWYQASVKVFSKKCYSHPTNPQKFPATYTVAMNSKRVYAGITPPERLSCIDGVDTAILRGGEDNGRGAGVRSNAVDCVKVFVVADGLTTVRGKKHGLMNVFACVSTNKLTC